jgi:DnaJ-class molecular chaperone
VVVRQIAPGMVQQMQTVCNECRGSGQVISEKDKCPGCHGQKVCQEKKVLEVHIEKGMVNNQKITFQGEADEAPGRGLHSHPFPLHFSLLCPFWLNFSLLCPPYDPN